MNINMTPLDMQVQQRQLERAIDRQIDRDKTAQLKPHFEHTDSTKDQNWIERLAEMFLTPRPAG